ncbi:MAG: 3'-5' exonuclease [Cyanobacteria bacterium]|nr:3'-5' exonuclease [Cyanobacteria bacterium CG_2015-16_32_12]NCO78806.1 3'-5' exonuclease [Cyanobacteria bacterium CG_2015-22_32_23]NCQ04647.1 3'-5' exonuclease [Cyanobacteria bacterium CG_2015-09_32_10]NCQ40406.1 3'-5' exonuclease [Cyanobacteria bacterium CG_2015-04_32_10]NCS85905.1 3'-5' exonuclease [Cyanobacteria bacterium CG_2015-02_32_10]
MTNSSFIVIDTEGSDILREIAIIDGEGNLIYEAFTDTENKKVKLKVKSLELIIEDLKQLLPDKIIICHNAQHDANVLRNSFRQCRQNFPKVTFLCTVELARNNYPNCEGYSLKFLSKKLRLKVSNKLFRDVEAHSARYDAQFTLQLYLHLLSLTKKPSMSLSNIVNPFSSNRVDNPFQSHLDFNHIYQSQFHYLKSIVEDIKSDNNSQSKAVVVMGEAGNGKTHLMMRLAKATLETNRLLYVRQPNNSQSVMHHIYSRILESFAQKVNIANSERTQLDLLLVRSFTKILELIQQEDFSQKLESIILALKNDSLCLFDRLGKEGTQQHGNNWKYIDNKITQWWETNYSAGGYSPHILQGIIKFCSYKDNPITGIKYKDQVRRWLAGSQLSDNICEQIGLNNWQENLSREDFALEAMSLFGKLSTLDEPLIIVFDQLESLISNPSLLISFGNAIREILTQVPNSLIIVNLFPDRWYKFQQYFDVSVTDRLSQHQITLSRPDNQQLKQILSLKCEGVGVKLEELFNPQELSIIFQESSIRKVINKASDYFRYKSQNISLPVNHNHYKNQESLSNQSLTSEEKLIKLETAFKEFVNICLPLINSNINIQFDSQINNNSTILPEKETLLIEKQEIIKQKDLQISPLEAKLIQTNNDKTSLALDLPKPKVENKSTLLDNAITIIEPLPLIKPINNIDNEKSKIKDYLVETKQFLEEDYHNPHIITDDDDIGKLVIIMEAFQKYDNTIQIDQLRLGKKSLPNHLLIIKNNLQYTFAFLQIGGAGFTARMKNFNQLVSSHNHIKFTLLRDEREGFITGKVGKEEIEKLNYTKNGEFLMMDKQNRVIFELIYKLIIDIQEGDLDVQLNHAIATLIKEYKSYGLIEKIFYQN